MGKLDELIEKSLKERVSDLQTILNNMSSESDRIIFLDGLWNTLYQIERYATDSRMPDDQVGKAIRRIVNKGNYTL